ncbi:MAG: sugar transferase [Planctomycetota bacterium]|jgi:lipopolysaccharide/colanic/teichoic acid biosynthesis glycosyltransferase
MLKRTFDIVFASLALLATLPLLCLAGLAIKLTSRGPLLYTAKRAGLGGEPFGMLKLRTMSVGSDATAQFVTAEHDQRVTPVGRILRKFKIDELPQFWNVLVGEMSVVGPRPETWDFVRERYTDRWRRTLSVRPGIASSADVRWYPDLTYHDPPPAGVPIQEYYLTHHMPLQLEESLRYVERQSFLYDLRLLVQTAWCVLVRSWLPPERRPPDRPAGVDA